MASAIAASGADTVTGCEMLSKDGAMVDKEGEDLGDRMMRGGDVSRRDNAGSRECGGGGGMACIADVAMAAAVTSSVAEVAAASPSDLDRSLGNFPVGRCVAAVATEDSDDEAAAEGVVS